MSFTLFSCKWKVPIFFYAYVSMDCLLLLCYVIEIVYDPQMMIPAP
jgi:hypothetical protein